MSATFTTALHAEELALLRGVCADPDSDAPRLVLADWYDETGEPLLCAFAAFIRQSIADLRTPPEPKTKWTSRYGGLVGKEISSITVANERAKAQLLAMTADNLNGHQWADRLIGGHIRYGTYQPDMPTGWHRPERWERGFPAVVKFPSLLAWKRSIDVVLRTGLFGDDDNLYLRVPVLRTVVKGRRPALWPYDSRPPLVALERSDLVWCWSELDVYTGHRDPANITRAVHKYLPDRNRYYSESKALGAVELAFTDAGRVACGLPPRHHKPNATATSTPKQP